MARTDDDVRKNRNAAFEEEERQSSLSAQRRIYPIRDVLVTISTTTGKFPYMVKMEIVGVPFEVVMSSGTSGTLLSPKVYNRIVSRTKDPRYKLQEATGIRVRDVFGNSIKLLGILHAPCKFICARGQNSVIEMMSFLVAEKANPNVDGVLGEPEMCDLNISRFMEVGHCVMFFNNYVPPAEIAIVET